MEEAAKEGGGIKKAECPEFLAWADVEGGLVKIRECSHWWNGICENSLSPHAGQPCPWEGRPEEKDAE
jgi:hypothetical protein